MKKLICIISFFSFSLILYPQLGTTTSTIVSDNHSNGNFSSGSGGGTGMGNWTLSESNGSKFVGGTGLGSDGFGIWTNNGGSVSATRYFNQNLGKGDVFSILSLIHI